MYNKFKYKIYKKYISKYLRGFNLLEIGSAGDLKEIHRVLSSELYRIDGRSGSTKGVGEIKEIFVGDGAPYTMHVTKKTTGSSLYNPNQEILKRYSNSERFEVIREVAVNTVNLREHNEFSKWKIDYLKLDIQGAELLVLQNLPDGYWNDLAACEIEVSFIEIYKGGATAAKIFTEMENRNFRLIQLRKQYWFNEVTACTELAWADCIFVRNDIDEEGLSAISLAYDLFSIRFALRAVKNDLILGILLVTIKVIDSTIKIFSSKYISFIKYKHGSEKW